MEQKLKKRLLSIALGISLLLSVAAYGRAGAVSLSFIDITNSAAYMNGGFDPSDFPFGIECNDTNFVWVTIHNQGLIAKIDKNVIDPSTNLPLVEAVFQDPDAFITTVPSQNFYSVARDNNTGDLYINERDNGKVWRFDPSQIAWTRIPIVENLNTDDNVSTDVASYRTDVLPSGYEVEPNFITFNTSEGPEPFKFPAGSFSEVKFANGKIWVGLAYHEEWDNATRNAGVPIIDFRGLVKIDPSMVDVNVLQAVKRIPIPDAVDITGLTIDSVDSNIMWVTDETGSHVFKFNLTTEKVEQTINLSPGSDPRGIATNADNIFIALNKPAGGNSTILQINKLDTTQQIPLDTNAQNVRFGTFTVFVFGDFLIWTDQSQHVGKIDLVTGKRTVNATEFNESNHFGCIAKEDPTTHEAEFWFAGTGTSHVGIMPTSKFSVGGRASPTGHSGSGGYDASIVDETAPTIVGYNWKPDVASAGNKETVYAQILDDVGVDKAVLFYYGPEEDSRKAHSLHMSPINTEWYSVDIPGSSVQVPKISFWISAMDSSGNPARTDTTVINVHQGAPPPQVGPSVTNLPASVLAMIKPKVNTPFESLQVSSISGDNEISSLPDKILIKNNGNITADNIRIMLSQDIAKSFRLSSSMINSIKPHSTVTISLELIGNPNRDVYGGLTGYSGQIIVMGEHLAPIILPVNIETIDNTSTSLYLQGHRFLMHSVLGMNDQRDMQRDIKISSNGDLFSSSISLINSMLIKHPDVNHDYEVSTSNGKGAITSPSGELTIKNLSNKELQNIRIYLHNNGQVFMLDQNNIRSLAPNGKVSLKMISLMVAGRYSKDTDGELLIVPSNDLPIRIPVSIAGEKQKNSADEFTSSSSHNTVTTATDRIAIKNVGDRTMDSVMIMMSSNLQRVFSLSTSSFKQIGPGKEVIVDFKYSVPGLKTLMQNYRGELVIGSEHHNERTIPISIEWKKVESKHFIIYARSGDDGVAKQVRDTLESNYQKVTSRFGEMNSKTTIYITADMDEMKLVNPAGHPYYSLADDTVFVCACDNPKYSAMKEFLYRLIMHNYAAYHTMNKFVNDKENWLMDGVTGYLAAKVAGNGIEKKYVDAFTNEPGGFQWYGYASDAKYGATYTFFEFLKDKYGDAVIDKILYYLGSGMISNHRCDSLESCALLRAVYDVNGLNMEKSHADMIDVKTLAKEWEGYVIQHYGTDYIVQDHGYDLSKLNTFQKAEAMNAIARQDADLPLTPTEKAVLDLLQT